jgi:RIO-like serine/threonine protein kinase
MASLPLSFSLVIAHTLVSFQIGIMDNGLVQEESDVYLAVDPSGTQCILKISIGKNLFATSVKKEITLAKRELRHTLAQSTLCLEGIRLMKALYDVGYPTPTPIAHNRHIVCMSLVRARLSDFQSSYRWNSRRHLRAVDWYGRPVGSRLGAL